MQPTVDIKKTMQYQYAFIIPIGRAAAKFSKGDTVSDRQVPFTYNATHGQCSVKQDPRTW